jgi:hypothetical protein
MNREEESVFSAISESLRNNRGSWKEKEVGDQTVFENQKINATIKMAMPFVLVSLGGANYYFVRENAGAIINMIGLESLKSCALAILKQMRENLYTANATY